MRSMIIFRTALTVLTTVLSVSLLHAAKSDIDYDKMDRDLRIMEKIISTIVSEEDVAGYFGSQRVKGVYLEGYGVVFMVPRAARIRVFKGSETPDAEESFKKIREKLTDFFSSYADAIKQVKATDWITLVVNPPTRSSVWAIPSPPLAPVLAPREKQEKVEAFKPYPFIMSVRKSDITRYRENKIDLKQFSRTVLYSPIGGKSKDYVSASMFKDITVMRKILETVIEDHLNSSLSSESIQGTYLKDYGVLFTVYAGHFSAISVFVGVEDVLPALEVPIIDKKSERIEDVRVTILNKKRKSEESRVKQDEERIEKLTDELIEVIGDYGHTIRDLKPNDQIVILYSSSGRRLKLRGILSLMLTVRFKDIVDYSQGKITLEVLKGRVVSRSFE